MCHSALFAMHYTLCFPHTGEMEMLQQGGELIGMAGEEMSSGGEAAAASALLASVSSGDSSSSQMVSETPQLIKSSLGQFVVLQQNQVREFTAAASAAVVVLLYCLIHLHHLFCTFTCSKLRIATNQLRN